MTAIKIRQWPHAIDAGKATILDAALAAGIPYPHGCRSGECGSCKCHLTAGHVKMAGYSPDALSEEERAAGLILACRSRPACDIEVAWINDDEHAAIHAKQVVTGTVVRIEAATHDIARLYIDSAPFAFAAGQYANLTFNGLPARPYSLANRADDKPLEFHIRRVADGLVSTYVTQKLGAGDRVRIEGPYGSAYLRENSDRPLLLIAGGSGLAPMKSILLAALAQRWRGPIHLYHGVRDTCDLYDVELLSRLAACHGFEFVPVLSGSAPSNRNEFVHEAVARNFSNLDGFDVYLGGPPAMVDAATQTAIALGAARENIHADPFYQTQRERRGVLRAFGDLFRSRRTQTRDAREFDALARTN